MPLPTPSAAFHSKKTQILAQLAVPEGEYTDASPKGSVDAGIRDLIDEINRAEGLVTTSSCAGRVSVFVEGRKGSSNSGSTTRTAEGDGAKPASSSGGKGGGGTWLFVSHDPVVPSGGDGKKDGVLELLGLDAGGDVAEDRGVGGDGTGRLIHFKFEPMILHILTASAQHAQLVLKCALQAGFRESGAVSLLEAQAGERATPMVAVRSMGLGFESLVGSMDAVSGRKTSLVSEAYLKLLVSIANERFGENEKRIARFLQALRDETVDEKAGQGMSNEESKEARRERKREEGLRRQAEARSRREDNGEVDAYIEGLEEDMNLS